MKAGRTLASFAPLLAMAAHSLWPASSLANVLRYLAYAYILTGVVLRVRSGYIRRRAYWSADSWRKYLVAFVAPIVSLAMLVALTLSVDWHLPFVGASRSAVRSLWLVVILIFLIVGAAGTATLIESLHQGDPAQQFEVPGWLRFPRRKTV